MSLTHTFKTPLVVTSTMDSDTSLTSDTNETFRQQTVIVTGTASGIGRACTRLVVAGGGTVVGGDARDD